MLSSTPGGQSALVYNVPPTWPAPCLKGSALTQNQVFSELWFRFRAFTLHLATRAYLTRQLSPSGHYTSERLTTPYSGELPAYAALSQLANIARLPSHLLMFRPASLLATQVAPTAAPLRASGSRGFYVWAPHSSLPPRGPDILGVRIEQLTPGRLALPKIRSLVGCSARPDPYTPILERGSWAGMMHERMPLSRNPSSRQA